MRALQFLCVLSLPFFSLLEGGVNQVHDLEDLIQDFVLETKQINVPHFPNAFNPSIIRWKGRLLLSFRDIPDRRHSFNSQIYLIWMNEDFTPAGHAQLLETRYPHSKVPPRAEDARLIEVGGRLYIVYSDCKDEKVTRGGFRVYVAEMLEDERGFYLADNMGLFEYEGASVLLREKNWVPFDYQGSLLLAYSLDPHRIFLPHIGTNRCDSVALTHPDIGWEWGVLRGGTTALPIDGQRYLSFFHSSIEAATAHSNDELIDHYVMGAYTFSREPPFEIQAISHEPIVGKGFYHGPVHQPYWKRVRVVFPCGFVMDDSNIWITYGRQDHEAWVVKLDKEGLLKSLIPVRQSDKPLR